jgi:hypothetical protein
MTTPTLKVRFTQDITVHPPDSIDAASAEHWLRNDPGWILRDALDVDHGNIEVLEIND